MGIKTHIYMYKCHTHVSHVMSQYFFFFFFSPLSMDSDLPYQMSSFVYIELKPMYLNGAVYLHGMGHMKILCEMSSFYPFYLFIQMGPYQMGPFICTKLYT